MDKLEKYKAIKEELKNYRYACFVISFDEATVCPKKDKENSLAVSDYFYKKIIETTTSDEYYNLLGELLKDESKLSDVELMAIKKEYKDLTKMRKIPNEVLFKGMDIMSKASLNWENARDDLDYSKFEDNLKDLVAYYKEYITYIEDKYTGYDVLLDEMEDDFTMEMYDEFFSLLEKKILPLVKKILKI